MKDDWIRVRYLEATCGSAWWSSCVCRKDRPAGHTATLTKHSTRLFLRHICAQRVAALSRFPLKQGWAATVTRKQQPLYIVPEARRNFSHRRFPKKPSMKPGRWNYIRLGSSYSVWRGSRSHASATLRSFVGAEAANYLRMATGIVKWSIWHGDCPDIPEQKLYWFVFSRQIMQIFTE